MIEEIAILGFGAALLRSYAPTVFTAIAAPFAPTPLPAKDPTDLTLTPSSTEWSQENYCPRCKNKVGHGEFMADICNSCGMIVGTRGLAFKKRTVRQIYNGTGWVNQYNYDNDPANMEIVAPTPALAVPIAPVEPVKRTRVRANTGPR